VVLSGAEPETATTSKEKCKKGAKGPERSKDGGEQMEKKKPMKRWVPQILASQNGSPTGQAVKEEPT